VAALELRDAGRLELRPQDDSQATYAEKIEPAERRLDPGRPAAKLVRIVRALTPHIGAYLELAGGARLGVRKASAEPGDGLAPREFDGANGLLLGCAEGALRLEIVQPPGGRPMAARDYLRGHPQPALEG
jgi:methionyl-tRNA formyltransferase